MRTAHSQWVICMLHVAVNPWIEPLILFFIFHCLWCVAAVVDGDDGDGGGVDNVL